MWLKNTRNYNLLTPSEVQYFSGRLSWDLPYCLETFSQAFQDLFLLYLFGAKKGGTYVEIGCNVPVYTNNSYLVHKSLGWMGLSFDLLDMSYDWYRERPESYFIQCDVLRDNLNEKVVSFFPQTSIFDYLQLDIDPAPNTFAALQRLDHSNFRFRFITYEHDCYGSAAGQAMREASRELFCGLGYELVVPDVLVDDRHPYEDWWIDPLTCSEATLSRARILQSVSNSNQGLSPKTLLGLAIEVGSANPNLS